MNASETQTPLQRLAQSRLAIAQQMSAGKPAAASGRSGATPAGAATSATPVLTKAIWVAAQSWWRKQPVSVAIDLAEPVLGIYASRYPLCLVALAAGVGAATTLSRPWRWVSGKQLMWLAASSAGVPALLQSWSAQRKTGVNRPS